MNFNVGVTFGYPASDQLEHVVVPVDAVHSSLRRSRTIKRSEIIDYTKPTGLRRVYVVVVNECQERTADRVDTVGLALLEQGDGQGGGVVFFLVGTPNWAQHTCAVFVD